MRVLVLLSRFPYPLDKGDKLRAYHQLRQLSREHEICLFALTEDDVSAADQEAVAPLCSGGLHVHRLSRPGILAGAGRAVWRGLPLQVGYFLDPAAQRTLDRVLAQFAPEHVYCQLIRMSEYVRPWAGHLPMTVDYMDAFSAGMVRRLPTAPRWQRPIWRREARRLRSYEAEVFSWFSGHTIISEQDRELIDHERRDEITVVPNGIDTDFFRPRPVAENCDLLFCGNMSYHPNVDAAVFLAEEILPLVQRRHPQARLVIAGTNPAGRVQALAAPDVTVTGWVDDIRDAYGAARVFVAPMLTGTGLQNKLLEAMAMRLPCVTTPLANNALHGQPDRDLLVGTSAAELAAQVSSLLDDPRFATAVAERGRAFVQRRYDWAASTERLADLFSSPVTPLADPAAS